MKNIFLSLIIGLALTSCELDFSSNGDLDGNWQMTRIDTVATGGTKDMYGQKVYWSVQKKLLETRQYPQMGVIFHFEHANNQLKLRDPYWNNREEGDVKITDVEEIKHMGVNVLDETFNVLELNSDNMVLQSDVLRLSFRRY